MPDSPMPATVRVRRYLVVGLWNTAFGYAAYVVLMATAEALGSTYLAAVLPAHVVGTVMSWWTQKTFVYPDGEGGLASFGRFSVVYLGALALQFALLPLGVEVFGLPPWLAELFVLGIIAVVNYFLGYFVTFRVGRS